MLTNTNNHLMLTEKSYNIGKTSVQVILPAVSALYFGLASIWGLPSAEQVVGTLAIITTFLGVCLGLSSRQYEASGAAYDGQMVVTTIEDGPKLYSLELNGAPEEIENKKSINFKINKGPEPLDETAYR